MTLKEYKDAVGKIKCTGGFRVSMEKQLSAPPEQFADSEDGFERAVSLRPMRMTAAAAVIALTAVGGGLMYRTLVSPHVSGNIPPEAGTEVTEATAVTAEGDAGQTETADFSAHKVIKNFFYNPPKSVSYYRDPPGQISNAVIFELSDSGSLLNALLDCTYEEADINDFSYEGSYCLGNMWLNSGGMIYTADTFTKEQHVYRAADGNWESVITELDAQLRNDKIAAAVMLLMYPEQTYSTMSADIDVRFSGDCFALYDASGSGHLLYDKTKEDEPQEYIFIRDDINDYTGELVSHMNEGCGMEFFYTEHTPTERIGRLSSSWAVAADSTGITSMTNGDRFYNTPWLETAHVKYEVLDYLRNLTNDLCSGEISRDDMEWNMTSGDGMYCINAHFKDPAGKDEYAELMTDSFGTPVFWSVKTGNTETLRYSLSNIVYDGDIDIPEPVLVQLPAE